MISWSAVGWSSCHTTKDVSWPSKEEMHKTIEDCKAIISKEFFYSPIILCLFRPNDFRNMSFTKLYRVAVSMVNGMSSLP